MALLNVRFRSLERNNFQHAHAKRGMNKYRNSEKKLLFNFCAKINGGDGTEEVVITKQRKVIVQRSKFMETETLDIRTWLETPKYRGFTKKGINIPIEKGDELAKKILKVVKEGEAADSP